MSILRVDTIIPFSAESITISGSLSLLGNLEVAGTTTTIDSTTVDIGTNIIDLNGTGAVLAGLRVKDVTSPNTISGSFLWNSTTDRWIAGPSGSELNVLLASGDGVVSGSSQVSFSGIADKPSLISGSIQVDHDATTNFVANEHVDHSGVTITAGSGLSGGGNLTATRTLTLDTGSAHFTGGVKAKLNTDGVVSGSAQIDQYFTFASSDESTPLTTGTSKITFRTPHEMVLFQIPRASLTSGSTSGNVIIDINENGSSILGGNKLSIDANEKTSTTAATATTLADTTLADDAEITVDIDSAGTGAAGLKITFYYRKA